MNNPDMVKSMANMQKSNPGMFNQAQMNARTAQNTPGNTIGDSDNPIRDRSAQNSGQNQTAPAQGMPPNGMPNMEEMMKNGGPGVDGLLGNKDMINTMFTMLKSNPAMIKMMISQMGPDHPASKFLAGKTDAQLLTMVTWLERIVKFISFIWPVIKLIRKYFKALVFFFLCWIVYRYIL